jgi:hypothetical protein
VPFDRFLYVAAVAAILILTSPALRSGYRLLRMWLWWRQARVRLEGVAPDRSVAFPPADLPWAELALKRGLVARVEPYPRQVYVRPGIAGAGAHRGRPAPVQR